MNKRQKVQSVVVVAVLVMAGRVSAAPRGGTEPGSAADAVPPPPIECVLTIKVEDRVQWLSVLPERQPPTTSRLSFDEMDGSHVEIEWDPYDGRGLSREVALTAGTWQVSLWSESQRDSLNFEQNYAWQTSAGQTCADWSGKTGYHLVDERRDGKVTPARILLRRLEKKPLGPLGYTGRSEVFGVSALPLPGDLARTFGITDAPDQVAQMLVRAITRTVKRKAVRLATTRLRSILCVDDKDPKRGKLLPATCKLFSDVDLRSLSATARPALTALASDLLRHAAGKIEVRPALATRTLETAVFAVSALRNRPDITAAEIQGAFLTTARGYLAEEDDVGMCAARLALSLVAYCHASSQCGPGFIRDVVTQADDYYKVPEGCASWKPAIATIDRIERTIAEGRRVFDVARTVTNADRLKGLARASLRLLVIAACDGSNTSSCRAAERLSDVGINAIEGDVQATMRAWLSFFADSKLEEPWTERQKKFATLFFNFIGEAAAIVPGSPEEAKAAQARVEHALETLLDDSANRDGRHGDRIVGLGTGLRLMAAYEPGQGFHGPVSVPLALTFDLLSNRGDRSPGKAKGLHFEIGFLDVGNYLRVNEEAEAEDVTWTDVASFSAGAGYFWGDDAMPFYFGVTSGIAPGVDAEGDRRWTWHFGGQAGLYLPVIDFN